MLFTRKSWFENPQVTTELSDGSTIIQDMNYKQFATPETAAYLAKELGLIVFTLALAGNSKHNVPMLMLNLTGDSQSAALNAGLVADTAMRYGISPGSYGRYLIERDILMIS